MQSVLSEAAGIYVLPIQDATEGEGFIRTPARELQ